jgi:hypothetical protein
MTEAESSEIEKNSSIWWYLSINHYCQNNTYLEKWKKKIDLNTLLWLKTFCVVKNKY